MYSISTKDKKAYERYKQQVKYINSLTGVDLFETDSDKLLRIEKLKKNYEDFVEYYFPHYASSKCADFQVKLAYKIRKNKHIKLLLGWGRGLAKSTHIDLLIPLWLWINNDLKVMLLVGQNEKKGQKLLSDLQAEFEANQRLINDFGKQVRQGNWEEGNFITNNDCAFFSLGIGQSPRGIRYKQFRPDYIAADDWDTKQMCKNPARIREMANWACEDLIPCMDERGSRYIHVNNIFAPHTILTEIRDTRLGFEFIQQDATDFDLNPTWHQKYSKEYYLMLHNQIGSLSFQAEFNNKPYVQGTIFKNDMINWSDCPRIDHFDHIVAFWDVAYSDAKTADFNAVKIWGLKNKQFFCLKAFVRQCKMSDAINFMFDFNEQLPKSVHINYYFEAQFWNDALMMVYNEIATKKGKHIPLIKAERPKTNKFDRIVSLLPFYQQSRIFYNKAEKASNDMQVGIAQLLSIEHGSKEHDDSPDADEAAIAILNKYIRASVEPLFGFNSRKNKY
jgi:predicted phage terminase large subunit-like protein